MREVGGSIPLTSTHTFLPSDWGVITLDIPFCAQTEGSSLLTWAWATSSLDYRKFKLFSLSVFVHCRQPLSASLLLTPFLCWCRPWLCSINISCFHQKRGKRETYPRLLSMFQSSALGCCGQYPIFVYAFSIALFSLCNWQFYFLVCFFTSLKRNQSETAIAKTPRQSCESFWCGDVCNVIRVSIVQHSTAFVIHWLSRFIIIRLLAYSPYLLRVILVSRACDALLYLLRWRGDLNLNPQYTSTFTGIKCCFVIDPTLFHRN